MNENKVNSDPMKNENKSSSPEKPHKELKKTPVKQSESQTPKVEESKAQESKAQESKAQESKAQESKAQESKAQEPKAQEPKAQEPKAQEPKAQEPKAQEPKAQEPKSSSGAQKDSFPTVDKTKPTPKKSGSGLASLALLVSLLAAGGAGYNWYQANVLSKNDEEKTSTALASLTDQQASLDEKLSNIESSSAQFTSSLNEIKSSTVDLESNLNDRLETQFKALKGDVDQQVLVVNEEVNDISMQMSQGLNHVKLLEVLQLVSRADQHIKIDQSVDQAINALMVAQSSLQKVSGFEKQSLEQSLSQQLQQLQSIDQHVRSDAAAQLIGMVNGVDKLPLYQDVKEVKPEEAEAEKEVEAVANPPVEKDQPWYQSFSQGIGGKINKLGSELVSDLSNMVTVQDKVNQAAKDQEQPKALYVPADQFYLVQNLKLSLLSAQNALIQKENAVYLENLQLAKQWLEQYFDTSASLVSANIVTIEGLLKVNLEPVKADMSPLISQLEKELNQQQDSNDPVSHNPDDQAVDLKDQSNSSPSNVNEALSNQPIQLNSSEAEIYDSLTSVTDSDTSETEGTEGTDQHQLNEGDIKDILNDFEEYTGSAQIDDSVTESTQNQVPLDSDTADIDTRSLIVE